MLRSLSVLVLTIAAANAQNAGSIQATGTATINVPPDQAQLSAGVVTQAATAEGASQQNATQTTAMINALKTALGTSGTVQTVEYSVHPRYSSSQPPVIIGYTASNTVRVTTSNLNLVGPLIDAANQAGANNISGVTFSLQDPDPVLQQALSKAAKQAVAHAGAIAQGLGARTGAVLSAQEGTSVTPYRETTATASTTPIQTGTVNVQATVTVSVALAQ